MMIEVEITKFEDGELKQIKADGIIYDVTEHENEIVEEIPELETEPEKKLTRKPNRGFPQRGSAYNRGRSRF